MTACNHWDDWIPTADHINRLPEPLRRFIHDLETIADQGGMVQQIASLKDQVAGLLGRLADQTAHMPEIPIDHPELAAIFQAIRSGPLGANADEAQLAAGLRLVADAIDPPPCTCRPGLTCTYHQKELGNDLAAILALPKKTLLCLWQAWPYWI